MEWNFVPIIGLLILLVLGAIAYGKYLSDQNTKKDIQTTTEVIVEAADGNPPALMALQAYLNIDETNLKTSRFDYPIKYASFMKHLISAYGNTKVSIVFESDKVKDLDGNNHVIAKQKVIKVSMNKERVILHLAFYDHKDTDACFMTIAWSQNSKFKRTHIGELALTHKKNLKVMNNFEIKQLVTAGNSLTLGTFKIKVQNLDRDKMNISYNIDPIDFKGEPTDKPMSEVYPLIIDTIRLKGNVYITSPHNGTGKTVLVHNILNTLSHQKYVENILYVGGDVSEDVLGSQFAHLASNTFAKTEDDKINVMFIDEAQTIFDKDSPRAQALLPLLDGTYKNMYNLVVILAYTDSHNMLPQIFRPNRCKMLLGLNPLSRTQALALGDDIRRSLSADEIYDQRALEALLEVDKTLPGETEVYAAKDSATIADVYQQVKPASSYNLITPKVVSLDDVVVED